MSDTLAEQAFRAGFAHARDVAGMHGPKGAEWLAEEEQAVASYLSPPTKSSTLPEYGDWLPNVWNAYLRDLVGWENLDRWARLPGTFRWHEFHALLAQAIASQEAVGDKADSTGSDEHAFHAGWEACLQNYGAVVEEPTNTLSRFEFWDKYEGPIKDAKVEVVLQSASLASTKHISDLPSEETQEVKPCPFCAGTDHEVMIIDTAWIQCAECGAEGPWHDTPNHSGRAEAVEAWNTRKSPEPKSHRFGSPPEPVANPSAEWCAEYADWYYQGKG